MTFLLLIAFLLLALLVAAVYFIIISIKNKKYLFSAFAIVGFLVLIGAGYYLLADFITNM